MRAFLATCATRYSIPADSAELWWRGRPTPHRFFVSLSRPYVWLLRLGFGLTRRLLTEIGHRAREGAGPVESAEGISTECRLPLSSTTRTWSSASPALTRKSAFAGASISGRIALIHLGGLLS